MIVQVFGALALVLAAFGLCLLAAYRKGKTDGKDELRTKMAENRAQRRAEQRALSAVRGHQLAPFPGDDWAERLASTGELRALAETGDMDTIRGHVAAFFRNFALDEWTRKKESAA